MALAIGIVIELMRIYEQSQVSFGSPCVDHCLHTLVQYIRLWSKRSVYAWNFIEVSHAAFGMRAVVPPLIYFRVGCRASSGQRLNNGIAIISVHNDGVSGSSVTDLIIAPHPCAA